MANRRRKGRDLSGWLVLDKPVGITSTRALSEVKRLFGAAKAGHAGTLDPLASGLLPIALGDATKTVPFVVDGRKIYRFTVRWGIETDTDDAEGKPVAEFAHRPSPDAVAAALSEFIGEVMQVPPAYSAVKIAGERAYDLAREGAAPVLEARPVTVHRLALVGCPDDASAELEAECGKGTYVRAIARDLGRALGTCGHVTALRRLMVGPFDEGDMVTLDTLRAVAEEEGAPALEAHLRPVERALTDLPSLAVGGNDVGRLMRGQPVLVRGRDALPAGTVYATTAGRLLAIGEIERGEFMPRRVFRPGQ